LAAAGHTPRLKEAQFISEIEIARTAAAGYDLAAMN
jgi:hypothetical protein